MANLHFSKDQKADKKLAIQCMEDSLANWIERYKFHVKVAMDDGGSVLEVFVEVDDPSAPILSQCPDFPLFEVIPKWGGWRCQVVKVPAGYIDVILLSSEPADY